jgi:hypothetical protein
MSARVFLRARAWLGVLALTLVALGGALVLASAHAAEVARAIAPLDGGGAALPVAPWAAGAGTGTGAASAPASRWEVRTQDITLSHTLERWAAQAGYRLKWDASRNFLIGAPDAYDGGFEDALQAVLGSAGIRGSDYPLEACIYANTPPLVRITRQGEQARECHAS